MQRYEPFAATQQILSISPEQSFPPLAQFGCSLVAATWERSFNWGRQFSWLSGSWAAARVLANGCFEAVQFEPIGRNIDAC